MALILLRNLPGVGPVEWAMESRPVRRGFLPRFDSDPDHDIEARALNLSLCLFGIDAYDTDEIDEAHFEPVEQMMRDESDAYWAKHGWDVTDGNGKQLAVMDYLLRPMVCMVERLHPEARYTGDTTEAWGRQLEEDAKRFRPSR